MFIDYIGKLGQKREVPINRKFFFTRTKKIQEKYEKHKKFLKDNNLTTKEFICKKIIKDNLFVITKNKFPYYIKDIEHYLLWINPKYKNIISDETIYEYLTIKFDGSYFTYFENIEEIKSVCDVRHLHIFIF